MEQAIKTARSDRFQPLVALRALRGLIQNPEDSAKVFELIRAMAGASLRRNFHRFRSTETGRRVLDDGVNLIDTLRDRESLAALPAGSLGRAYHDFIYGESLSAESLVQASIDDSAPGGFDDANFQRFTERLRDQHDLAHTVTGYGRDVVGETCLLAFSYAQTGGRGIGLIALVGAWKGSRRLGPSVLKAAWAAYRAGRHADWLPAQDWERLLRLPLDEVRSLLAVKPPAEAYFESRQALALATAAA